MNDIYTISQIITAIGFLLMGISGVGLVRQYKRQNDMESQDRAQEIMDNYIVRLECKKDKNTEPTQRGM